MLGAIAGDIIGSVYEFSPMKNKDFQPLFHTHAHFTDDTVLTVAVADALQQDRDPVGVFKDWGKRYPHAGWGGMFSRWLFSDMTEPYGSFGNGAAMRVSPAAFLGTTLEEALEMAEHVTRITHDHPEGIKGAAATVTAIFLCRKGMDTEEIRELIQERYGYDLNRTVAEIRPQYNFNVTCQGTVPEAIICALEADDFEDAIRNAISLGGDADTLGAITGGIAEARFEIPCNIAQQAWRRLPREMHTVIDEFYTKVGKALPCGKDVL